QFNPPAHVIGMMFGPGHLAGYTASARAVTLNQMARQGGELSRLFAEHDRIVRHVLLSASTAVHNTMQSARDHAINQLLQQNYPQSTVMQTARSSQNSTGRQQADVPVRFPADRTAPLTWSAHNHLEESFTTRYPPNANYRSFIEDVISVY